MKLIEMKNIFSPFTNVKLVINGDTDVFKGYWKDVPAMYVEYTIETIIPIKHPDHDKLGMASVLIYKDGD